MEKVSCGGFYLGDNLSIENVDGKEILNVSGSLPEVTALDNGKVLGVVDGAWGKTDAPSGGEIMCVEFSVDGSTYSANKTPKEIFDAVNGGAFVYAVTTVSFGTQTAYTVYNLAAVGVEDEEYYTIAFSTVQVISGAVITQSLNHTTDDPSAEPEWVFTKETIPISS